MTSCADCPDLENGTRKRAVCCRRTGEAVRRARAEADVLAKFTPAPLPKRLAKIVTLGGTALESGMAVHPQWVSQDVRT